MCLSSTYVKLIRFHDTWVATVFHNYSPIIYRGAVSVLQSDEYIIKTEMGSMVHSHVWLCSKYEIMVDQFGIRVSSDNKKLEESQVDLMYICASDGLYLKNKEWFYFSFEKTIATTTKLNFDKISSYGLYSATDPVSHRPITIFDMKNQSDCEFGYLMESLTHSEDRGKLRFEIYSHGHGKTSVFQPVTVQNRMNLSRHVKDYICFLYWLIKQPIISGYNMCHYLPKCLVNKYVLEFSVVVYPNSSYKHE